MQAVLAAAPLVVACLLLVAGRGAVWASVAAVACAVVIAAWAFPIPVDQMWVAAGSLVPTTAEVLVILLGGVVLSEMLSTSGAQRRLAGWVQQCCADPGRAVLLIVLGITPFAESVTGFGIGMVIAVPLLRHIGLSATKSAVLGLLGLVTVPWGSLAPGTLVAAQLGNVDFTALGVRSAALSGVVFLVMGAAALLVAYGWRRMVGYLPDLAVVASVLWGAVWSVNSVLGTPLAGALGSLVAIGAALGLSKLRDRVSLRADPPTRQSLFPYSLLVGGLLITSLVVRAVGASGAWGWTASPATWLVITVVVTPSLVGLHSAKLRGAVVAGFHRWRPIAIATALFLALGGILTATGMSTALAEAASGLGPAYLLLVPVVGGVGGFITGSNTGANAMFAASQAQAAHALGVSSLHVLSVHNVASSLSIMAAPARVALAASLASAEPAPASTRTEASEAVKSVPTTEATSTAASTSVTSTTEETSATHPASSRTVMLTVLAADAIVVAALAVLSITLA